MQKLFKKTLTSYQDLEGGDILPLFDKNEKPVFNIKGKCELLQDTFFSSNHLQNSDFDDAFKADIESELRYIKVQDHENNSQFDLSSLNRDITIEETEAALHTLRKVKLLVQI